MITEALSRPAAAARGGDALLEPSLADYLREYDFKKEGRTFRQIANALWAGQAGDREKCARDYYKKGSALVLEATVDTEACAQSAGQLAASKIWPAMKSSDLRFSLDFAGRLGAVQKEIDLSTSSSSMVTRTRTSPG